MKVELKGNHLKQDKVTFIQGNLVNWFIVYELAQCSQELNLTFTLKYYLFGAVKLTKNGHSDKHSYPEYGIRLHSQLFFSVPNFDWEKMLLFPGYTIVYQCTLTLMKKISYSSVKLQLKN